MDKAEETKNPAAPIYLAPFDWCLEEELLRPLVIKSIKKKIKQLKTWAKEYVDKVRQLRAEDADPWTIYVYEKVYHPTLDEEIDRLQTKLRFLERHQQTGPQEDYTERRKLAAKSYPLTRLMEFDRAGFAKCPFHQEKTASFKYYPKSNTAHCFSCNTNADSIDLYQHLYRVDFMAAVNYLAGL